MRSPNLPHGKFYTIVSQTDMNPLPKEARGHMVMVLGWADQWDWVKVVTITSSATSTSQHPNYLPIYPSKKNPHNKTQLKSCNEWDAWTLTDKRSYVKMDAVYEVPMECLMAAVSVNGRPYELQAKSWEKVRGFLRRVRREDKEGGWLVRG